MCGSDGKPGSVKTGRDWPPSRAREMSSAEIALDESLPINLGKPSDAVKAVRLSCFLSWETVRSNQQPIRVRNAEKRRCLTYDLARRFFVRDLELFEVEQLDVERNKLFERDPALLVLHPLGELALGDLIDEPFEVFLDVLDAALSAVAFAGRLEDLGFNPERKDLAPDVQVRFRSGRRRDGRDFAREHLHRFGKLALLSELESCERVERRSEQGEELGVGRQGYVDFAAVLATATLAVGAARREII